MRSSVDALAWEVFYDSVDVRLGASKDGHPFRASSDGIEEVVIPEEADQSDCWKLEGRFVRGSAPDGGSHGYEVVVAEGFRVSFPVQVLANAEWLLRLFRTILWAIDARRVDFTFFALTQEI